MSQLVVGESARKQAGLPDLSIHTVDELVSGISDRRTVRCGEVDVVHSCEGLDHRLSSRKIHPV